MPASCVEVSVLVHYNHSSLFESGTKPRHFENPGAPVAVYKIYKIPIYTRPQNWQDHIYGRPESGTKRRHLESPGTPDL